MYLGESYTAVLEAACNEVFWGLLQELLKRPCGAQD